MTTVKQPLVNRSQSDGIPTHCFCGNDNSFERYPQKDIKYMPSGKLIEEAWRCKICGYIALVNKLKGGK